MNKILFAFLAICILYLPNIVYAADFQTKEGYVIPESDYNNLKELYTDAYIYMMSETDYYRIMTMGLDFDNVNQENAYIKTTYNHMTGERTETVITEEEYNAVENVNDNSRASSDYVETDYKRIVLTIVQNSSETLYFVFTAIWKNMPAVRSYDVIAARFINCEVFNGTQMGTQTYKSNGQYYTINYAWNGTNINNQDNGFGISMNLVNDSITELQLTIESALFFSVLPAGAFASYQHATQDVSLAASRTYTLGAGGLGSVILFQGGIENAYDAMQGVYAYVSGN